MTKRRLSPDGSSHQLPLPLNSGGTNRIRAGRLGRKEAVREALTNALSCCGLSREDVAAELSRLTGEAVSVNHINNWAAGGKKDWRFPLEFVSAFCLLTGDFGLIEAVLDGTDRCLVDQKTLVAAEYGKLLAEEKKRAQLKRELLEKMELR